MRRWLIRIFVALVVVVVLAATPWLWVSRTADGHIHTVDGAPSRPVVLVLGAGLQPDGTPSPFLRARLDVAARLLAAGKASVVLVSGDNRAKDHDEPTAMRDYLVSRGIPESRVVRDFAGRDTYDSCARTRRIFGVSEVLVVSQGYHLPRAVATCRALGLDADGVGDQTMEAAFPGLWASYSLREKAAAGKTVLDLVTRRDPVLGREETAVRDALVRARAEGRK